MTEEELDNEVEQHFKGKLSPLELKLANCPYVFDWCKYKGKVYFAALNYDKSMQAQHPIIDLHYCATAALNNNLIEKTVRYNPKNFSNDKTNK